MHQIELELEEREYLAQLHGFGLEAVGRGKYRLRFHLWRTVMGSPAYRITEADRAALEEYNRRRRAARRRKQRGDRSGPGPGRRASN